jgi:hypothetical protein
MLHRNAQRCRHGCLDRSLTRKTPSNRYGSCQSSTKGPVAEGDGVAEADGMEA